MTAEIISVGTEILMGNIVNTNAAYIAEKLATMGIANYYQTVVGDNVDRLKSVIEQAVSRSDVVIIGGGLGPTEDDLSKETAAEVLGITLRFDNKAWDDIVEFFDKRGMDLPDNNEKQAMVPSSKDGIVMYNPNGTAPGVILEKDEKSIILLPGPPSEMIPMWDEQVTPYLQSKTDVAIFSKMVKFVGIGESKLESEIRDLIHSDNPTVATYAKTGEVHVRVTGSGKDESEAKKLVKPVVKELKSRYGAKIYSTDEDTTLEMAVVELLSKNNLTIATAESCTGGMLAGRIINVPGASEVVKEGFITYSNKAKRNLLGVKKSTLAKYGAVSEQTAKEMVKGVISVSKADVALSTTGIAGPDGGTEEKPVGLVYIGCNVCGRVKVKECHFRGTREMIRNRTTTEALALLRMCILEYYTETKLK